MLGTNINSFLDMNADFMDSTSAAEALLSGLQDRYEEEKDLLLARLRGSEKVFMSERERQAELVRLRQEQRKAAKEGRFDTAAMLMGLAERNKAEVRLNSSLAEN